MAVATALWLVRVLVPRCAHDSIRCVHGDEINHANGRRTCCTDCGWYLDQPLPLDCTQAKWQH